MEKLHCSQRRIQDFPEEGGTTPTYNFAKISRKLHEIERIRVPRGRGGRPSRPPKSATGSDIYSFVFIFLQRNN